MSKSVISGPVWMMPVSFVGLPTLGVGAGLLVKAIAGWVVSLPWAPFQGPFEVVERIPEPYSSVAAPVVGGLAGLVLAVLIAWDQLKVTIADDEVTLVRGDNEQRLARAAVAVAYLDENQLVLVGRNSEELVRETVDFGKRRLADEFGVRGFPWHEGDPYDADFHYWVVDTPGLPPGANALLSARERAVGHGDKSNAAELRTELAKLGVVVRDKNKRQYWRLTKGHA
jgi:hypothetical protein